MGNLVQLSDVHTYLQITYDTDDPFFSDIMIPGASAACESYCRVSFSAQIPQTDFLDGGVRELILKHRPIASIVSIVDLSQRQSQVQLGKGNGNQTSFTGVMKGGPWIPGSVMIVAGPYVAVDDGNGNLTGTNIAAGSTFNYSSGIATINFTVAPIGGTLIKGASNPVAAIVDASVYDVDELAGLIIAQPNPPSDFPLPAAVFSWMTDLGPVWARGRRRWQANYVQGFACVPPDAKLACLIMIAERYNRRDDLSREEIGDYSYEIATGDLSGFSPRVEQLLKPYFEIVF